MPLLPPHERVWVASPAPDGTVLVVGGGVFSVRLVGEDGVVGDGVGPRAGDLAKEESLEATRRFELGFLLVVDVEQIELARAVCELLGDAFEQAAQDGCAEGVEEKEEGGTGRQREIDGVAARDASRRVNPTGGAPEAKIAASDAGEGGV